MEISLKLQINNRVKCLRTLDVGFCLDILTNEDIFDAISEDGATVEDLNVDVINQLWVRVEVDGLGIGVVQFKRIFSQCWDAHIHILPEYRKEHSLEAGEKIWQWVMDNLNGSLIYTNVPVFCESVKDFLLNFGFKHSGELEKAWLKNGKSNDMWILTKRAK